MRSCSKCGVAKPTSEFYIRKRNGLPQAWCIACTKALRVDRQPRDTVYKRILRKYVENTPQDIVSRKDYQLQYHYGITIADYKALLEQQNYRCAVCDTQHMAESANESIARGLAVDHDHVTKLVRGLLCGNCNKAIGCFRDSPQLLRKAADYLELRTKQISRASIETEEVLSDCTNLVQQDEIDKKG